MKWKILLIPPFVVFLAYLSWWNPTLRPYWDALDLKAFQFLNSWIQHNPFWQNFWAFTGHRIMDWIHDIVMLIFFGVNIYVAAEAFRRRKIAEMVFSILFIALIICMVNGLFFPEFIHVSRKSPTSADKTAFRLSSVIDWIKVKDHSRKSFPGDHATTAALFACITFYLMGKRAGFVALLYAIFWCLPRLVAGAHWLTDSLIGSVSIAIIASSIAFGTPLAEKCISGIETLITRRKKECPNPSRS